MPNFKIGVTFKVGDYITNKNNDFVHFKGNSHSYYMIGKIVIFQANYIKVEWDSDNSFYKTGEYGHNSIDHFYRTFVKLTPMQIILYT